MNADTVRAMLGEELFKRYTSDDANLIDVGRLAADTIKALRFLTFSLQDDGWETGLGWKTAADRIIYDLESLYMTDDDDDDEPSQED